MKCRPAECKKVAAEIRNMSKQALEKQLVKCNRCFFAMDPATRYNDRALPYQTRNAVGALYALVFIHRREG